MFGTFILSQQQAKLNINVIFLHENTQKNMLNYKKMTRFSLIL